MECCKCNRKAKEHNIKLMPVDYSNVGESWICTDCVTKKPKQMEITREQQLYDKLKFARERNNILRQHLQQSQDRERVLREALELIKKDLQEYCDGVLVYSTAFEIAMPIIDKALEASK